MGQLLEQLDQLKNYISNPQKSSFGQQINLGISPASGQQIQKSLTLPPNMTPDKRINVNDDEFMSFDKPDYTPREFRRSRTSLDDGYQRANSTNGKQAEDYLNWVIGLGLLCLALIIYIASNAFTNDDSHSSEKKNWRCKFEDDYII